MTVRDALTNFKLYVASLELIENDTLALDRALATASELLYDVRHAIDHEWAKARTKPATIAKMTEDELNEMIDFIRNHY